MAPTNRKIISQFTKQIYPSLCRIRQLLLGHSCNREKARCLSVADRNSARLIQQ